METTERRAARETTKKTRRTAGTTAGQLPPAGAPTGNTRRPLQRPQQPVLMPPPDTSLLAQQIEGLRSMVSQLMQPGQAIQQQQPSLPPVVQQHPSLPAHGAFSQPRQHPSLPGEGGQQGFPQGDRSVLNMNNANETINMNPIYHTYEQCIMNNKKTKPRVRYRVNYKLPKNHRNRYRRSINKIIENDLNNSKFITNLSTKTLTTTQIKVLSLGMTFVPGRNYNKEAIKTSVAMFQRSNRIKHFFKDRPESEPHPFRPKSTWVPPRGSEELEKYLERIQKETETISTISYMPNLCKKEKLILKELANDKSLIIKKADKGSGIVVEDKDNYINLRTNRDRPHNTTHSGDQQIRPTHAD